MKTSKKEKKRLITLSALLIFLICTLIISTYSDWSQIAQNNANIASLEVEYEDMLLAEKSLKSDVTKLSDPEYVARYAKEKYLFSSEGEYIIRMD